MSNQANCFRGLPRESVACISFPSTLFDEFQEQLREAARVRNKGWYFFRESTYNRTSHCFLEIKTPNCYEEFKEFFAGFCDEHELSHEF